MAEAYKYSYFAVSIPEEFILHIELNRPESLNTFNLEQIRQTASVFKQATSDPNVRAIILSARGKAFSAGLDLNKETTSSYMSPSKSDPARTANQIKETVKFAQSGTDAIAACSKPIICVLHGIAIGFAIDISSACDIRIAAKDTRLSIKEVDIGLAADCGTLQRFPRVVGNDSWTRELAFSGRFFNAKEALERGFVSYVVEDREKGVTKAMDIARLVVGKSPVAVQGTKVLLDYSRDHSVREALEYTQLWNSIYLQTDDVKEAVASFFEKRKPKFAKL